MHEARTKIAWIKARLAEGRSVQLATYWNCWRYTARHIDMLRATKSGAFVQHREHWYCINGVDIRAF